MANVSEQVSRRRLTNGVWSAALLLEGRWLLDVSLGTTPDPDREPVTDRAVLYAYGFSPDLTDQDRVIVRGQEWAIAATPEVWSRSGITQGVVFRLQALVDATSATEAQLTDVCNLQTKGARTYSATTGAAIDTWTTYETGLACRVEARDSQANIVTAGVQELTEQTLTVSIPLTVDDVKVGDRVQVTASADPSLVGRLLYVKSVHRGTHATLRRLEVVEVQ